MAEMIRCRALAELLGLSQALMLLAASALHAQAAGTAPVHTDQNQIVTCSSVADAFERDLRVLKRAFLSEVDPFETSPGDIRAAIHQLDADIAALRKTGQRRIGEAERRQVDRIARAFAELPGLPLWEMVDANDWRPTNPKAIWVEPHAGNPQEYVQCIALRICRDLKVGASRSADALPRVTRPTTAPFGRFNRLVVWVKPVGSMHHFLDMAAFPHQTSRGVTDTDRNHWLHTGAWNRVVWDFHYHDEEYRSAIDRLWLRAQNRGSLPGEGELLTYYIADAVLLRVQPRKYHGWDPDPRLVVASQVGYKSIGRKRAFVSTDIPAERFTVWDLTGNIAALESKLMTRTSPTTTFGLADFSSLERDGRYEVRVGDLRSHPFVVAEDALRPALDAALYFLRCDRSACDTPYHTALSLDDARRLDTGEYQDFTGGWYDAGDTYQMPGNTAKMCIHGLRLRQLAGPWQVTTDPVRHMSDTLMAMKRISSPLTTPCDVELWRSSDVLTEEMAWGAKFLLNNQDESGGIYYGQVQLGLSAQDRERMKWAWYVQSYFTDNVAGTDDDKWWNVKTSPANSATTHLFIDAMARGAMAFRDADAELAAHCLEAARRAWQHALSVPENTDGRFAGGSVEYRSVSTLAVISLFLATQSQDIRRAALAKGNGLVDLLSLDLALTGEHRLAGFFWGDDTRDTPFANVQYLANPYVALARLCQVFPDATDWTRWYAALRISAEFYWKKIGQFHAPYHNMPAGLFSADDVAKALPERGPGTMLKGHPREQFIPVGGLRLRHFSAAKARGANTWPRAANASIIQPGLALIHMAQASGDLELEHLARGQMNWVLGCNPFAASTITGVGSDPILGMSGEAYIPGRVCYGAIGWDLDHDVPFHSRNSRAYSAFQWKEASIVNSAPFIETAGLLVRPATIAGTLSADGEPVSDRTVRIVRAGESFSLRTRDTGRFGPVTVGAGGTWSIRVGEAVVTVPTISSMNYDVPIDLERDVRLEFTAPARLRPGTAVRVTATVTALSARPRRHELDLRVFNLDVDEQIREATCTKGTPASVTWEVTPQRANTPFLLMVVPDGNVQRRVERIGEVLDE